MSSNKRVLYHLFLSELNDAGRSVNSVWRELALVNSVTADPITRWEEARYELELQFHMHEQTRKTTRLAYLSGVSRDSFKKGSTVPLQPDDKVEPGMAVILSRVPMPRALRPYVPLVYMLAKAEQETGSTASTHVVWDEATEEEKLALIAAGEGTSAVKPSPLKLKTVRDHAKQQHPADYAKNDKNQPKPPDGYVCNGCLEIGHHFRADCPRGLVPVVSATAPVVEKPLDKVAQPHGIPKRFLKAAKSHDADAMLTKDGEWVQRGRTPSLNTPGRTDIDVTRSVLQKAMDTVQHMVKPVVPLSLPDDDELVFDFEPYVQRLEEVEARAMAQLEREHPHIKNKNRSMCTYWLRGICHKSVLCEFLHEYNTDEMPICRFYVQAKCTNDACGYKHTVSESAKHRDVCTDYAMGFCPLGPKCTKEHIRRTAPTRGDFMAFPESTFLEVVAAFDAHTAYIERREAAARKRFAHPGVFQLLKRRKQQKKSEVEEESLFT